MLMDSPLLFLPLERSEFPRMWRLTAQLGLYIMDPAKDISQQARDEIYWLYQLLLPWSSKQSQQCIGTL